jgi:homoserine kinase
LAVALDCYVEVSVEPALRLELHTTGFGSDLPADASHLAARVAIAVAGHDRLAIEVDSAIPVGRGLGSSAAVAVAAAAAAGSHDAFSHGVEVDGHPENAAASAFGGLVVAASVGGRAVWRHLTLDPALQFVAIIPDGKISTPAARASLPGQVPHRDAAFNLGRMGLLIAGFADHSALLAEAGDDRLHQQQRTPLFPEAPALLAGMRSAGALTSFWSGSGPSLVGVCVREEAGRVARAAEALMQVEGVTGRVSVFAADRRGIALLPPLGQ